MVKNTVLLNIERYDELKGYEKLIDESNYICRHMFKSYYSVTENEVIDALKKQKDFWVDECDRLKNPKEEETTIKDLKQMGLFSLIKWKLKNKK